MTPRIKALQTLKQIEERALETLARDLTSAQSARANSEARIEALENRAATEARCTDLEALPYIGRFMATIRREQARESATCAELSHKIEGLRDQVMHHFTAGRSWEVLSDRLSEEILSARSRQAEAAIEDLTISRFGR